MTWVRKVLALFQKAQWEREFAEELDGHIAMAATDFEHAGASPEEAKRLALLKLGGPAQAMEVHRDSRGVPWLETLWQDLRYAVRMFAREPGFTAITTLTLALGIGANTAVFSIVDRLLLQPLPFPTADRLVMITTAGENRGLSDITYRVASLEEFRRTNRSFASITGWFPFSGSGNALLTGRGEPERVTSVDVAQNFLTTLGVRPLLGRGFTEEEATRRSGGVALLNYGFWQRRFAGDVHILGQKLILNGEPVTVVGVLPSTFDFASMFKPGTHVDVLEPPILDQMRPWGNVLLLIGRLRPEVPLASARAEFAALIPRLIKERPDLYWDTALLTDLKEYTSGRMRRALELLWGAVALVLLIVFVNLSSLLLARTASRQKEFAVRSALGAGSWRILRQLWTESLLLATLGVGFGLLLAWSVAGVLAHAATIAVPLLAGVRLNAATLWLSFSLGIVTVCVGGAVPAFRILAVNLQTALKASGRGFSNGGGRTRTALVISEVALAFLLLAGAGLLFRSFLHLLAIDLGFEPSHVTALRVDYAQQPNAADRVAFVQDLIARVAPLPGIESAGLVDMLPFDRNRSWTIGAKGVVYKNDMKPDVLTYVVDPGYLKTMGMRMAAGRFFDLRDGIKSELTIVVNEAAARLLWPSGKAVGRIAELDHDRRVIGIVRDARDLEVEQRSGPTVFLPMTQADPDGLELVMRSNLRPDALAATVRRALRPMQPNIPLAEFRPMQEYVERSISPRRFFLVVIGTFAGLALVLASLGIYGVISYSVTQRTREIGVRMALGETAASVQAHVVQSALWLVAAGTLIGALAAALLGHLVESLLYGVTAIDPITYIGIGILLTLVAAAAGYVPGRRAARVDPMVALRAE